MKQNGFEKDIMQEEFYVFLYKNSKCAYVQILIVTAVGIERIIIISCDVISKRK